MVVALIRPLVLYPLLNRLHSPSQFRILADNKRSWWRQQETSAMSRAQATGYGGHEKPALR